MANVSISGITWALSSQDIIELLKDSNSLFYKAFAGFITAATEIARQNALIQLVNAILKYEADHPRRAVSEDVDNQEYPVDQLPSDLVKVSTNVKEAENFLVKALNSLMAILNSALSTLSACCEAQLNQFNAAMPPQHQLTKTQQKALSQSYENIVEQTQKALPSELKTESAETVEKLVKNRAAVGLEMELFIKLLGADFKPSEIKRMVDAYKTFIDQYIKAEQENYARMQEIKHIEIQITAMRMTFKLVKGIELEQSKLDEYVSPALARQRKPFSTKPSMG